MLFCSVNLFAQNYLDLSFGNGGKIYYANEFGWATAIQPDGKILAAGEDFNTNSLVLYRYNIIGSLDSTFGINGKVLTKVSLGSYARSIIGQPDGKIIVAGHASYGGDDLALFRYENNGGLDSTFGTNGIAEYQNQETENAYSVGIQSNGKIIVMCDLYLCRYNTNGFIDTLFGNNGYIKNILSGYSVAIQNDDKIVAGSFNETDSYITRYNQDGSIDENF
jgi:uncharacterized delta-60 repeat protein